MEQEIKEIIERQLPAQVGEVLRKRLEQADIDAAKVKSLQSEVSDIRNKNLENMRIAAELEQQLSLHAKLADRENAVTKRENAIELELAKMRADNAERSKGDLFNLMGVVFKNPVWKENVSRHENGYGPTGSTNGTGGAVTTREVE